MLIGHSPSIVLMVGCDAEFAGAALIFSGPRDYGRRTPIFSLSIFYLTYCTSTGLEGLKVMTANLLIRYSRNDLDNLVTALDVEFPRLSECLVSPGWRLELGGPPMPAIHYCLSGSGCLIIEGQEPIPLQPHTLVVMPAGVHFLIEATCKDKGASPFRTMNGRNQVFPPGAIRRYAAGDGPPQLILVCGYFHARYGATVELFSDLMMPIVEQFDESDQIDLRLKSALAELVAEEVGSGAMTTTLLKQVLVMLLRRSLSSMNLWVERFSILSDPQIARAFAGMVARPGAPHCLKDLARTAGLSRTIFVERFTKLFGKSPMAVLRYLRMRHAAVLLAHGDISVDRAARECGYTTRTSFLRAFRSVHGCTPTAYLSGHT